MALAPPVVATLVVAGDVTTAQTAWVVGMVGVVAAELVARRAHRSTAPRPRGRRGARRTRRLVGAALPLVWGAGVLLARPLLDTGLDRGMMAGALAAVAAGLLLLLPLPTPAELASRPRIPPRPPGERSGWITGSLQVGSPRRAGPPHRPGPVG